jgi:hypothetical protein
VAVIAALACLSTVLSLVAAVGATIAALWARSGAQALDGFAAITLPLLVRLKQKVDPDPAAAVVAAAAAAPAPAIIEQAQPGAGPAVAARLPVIVAEDEDELRESTPDPVEPPETGPSRSGERARRGDDERPAGYFAPYVVPAEPPAPDTLPPSSTLGPGAAADAAGSERRRRAHELGQATERQRQLDARRQREAEEIARRVLPLSDEDAARPSGEGFAMDRPSWEGQTAVHERAQVEEGLRALPPRPAPRVVPGGAARGRGEGRPPGLLPPPPVAALPPPRPPRARHDSSPTLLSTGVVRPDPRAEPAEGVEQPR